MPHKTKVSEMDILRYIFEFEGEVVVGPSMKQIGRTLGITHQAVSERMKRMHRDGKIVKTDNGITLTEESRKRVKQVEVVLNA